MPTNKKTIFVFKETKQVQEERSRKGQRHRLISTPGRNDSRPLSLQPEHHLPQHLFPSWSTPILESVTSIGFLFFLFLVGLELGLHSICLSGRRFLSIAAAGISLPFIPGISIAVVLRRCIPGADAAGYAPSMVFMGVSMSITAFLVLVRILAELKLLTMEVGEMAMAAAAFNGVAAWVLLALAVALLGEGGQHKSVLVSVWVLICGVVFVTVEMVLVRPVMGWVARRAEGEAGGISESWVCLTLAGVLISGFFTNLIGIHSIFGCLCLRPDNPQGRRSRGLRILSRVFFFLFTLRQAGSRLM